jgi:CPA2 family monovalent cation:H+ antiporter-2
VSTGLCLGMVVVATEAGFSAELGAFIMGSILAETTTAEKVEHIVKPVKDLFGAIFFVSVGMLIDPATIMEYRWPVLWVTLLALVGKAVLTTAGALLSGQPLKQSIQVGMSMGQIGEFAFIVASLGLSLKVTSEFLFPVAVGASAITTFTTPYMIKYSESFYGFVEKIIPARWNRLLSNYSSGTQIIPQESDWKKLLKTYVIIILTNLIILLAIFLLALNLIVPFLTEHINDSMFSSLATLIISLLLASPFLWALMVRRPNNMTYDQMWHEKKYNYLPLLALEIVRVLLGAILISIWADLLFQGLMPLLIIVPLTVGITFLLTPWLQGLYEPIESRFVLNLNARETAASEDQSLEANISRKTAEIQSDLIDAHIVEFEVDPQAEHITKTLSELEWREKYGINLVYIRRGNKLISSPGRNDYLLPYDYVGVIATDEQLKHFKPVFDSREIHNTNNIDFENIGLQKIVVNDQNMLNGQMIRDSGIREKTSGLVIGIQRSDNKILNPDSTLVFETGDIVWVVGDKKKIQKLAKGQLPDIKAEP